jgi:hypothetical protein
MRPILLQREGSATELEKLRERVAIVKDDRAIEAELLSWSVGGNSDALVDLNVLPIQGIPLHPWSAKDPLAMFGLILEWLREEHASGFGSQA